MYKYKKYVIVVLKKKHAIVQNTNITKINKTE